MVILIIDSGDISDCGNNGKVMMMPMGLMVVVRVMIVVIITITDIVLILQSEK